MPLWWNWSDTRDLKSLGFIHNGSIPFRGTVCPISRIGIGTTLRMWREIIVGSSPTWGTMKKIIVRHKDFTLKVHISQSNTTIFDSYKVKSPRDMKSILYSIKAESSNKMAINKRNISSMIYEWRTHNLLYTLGIMRDRTKSVDLNIGQPWYSKVLYFILSPFYFHFY